MVKLSRKLEIIRLSNEQIQTMVDYIKKQDDILAFIYMVRTVRRIKLHYQI